MDSQNHHWCADWKVGIRAWIERGGHAILGQGRFELLEAIDRCHSISAAARQAGMSYRHAWLLVQSINEAAAEPLVTAVTGGRRGGGAQLTPRGHSALTIFRALQSQVERAAATCLARLVENRQTAVIRLAAAVSLEAVLGSLLVDYALQQPLVQVRAIYGASDALTDQILAGTGTDLFLSADDRQVDRLEAVGLVQPGSRVHVARNNLTVVGSASQAAIRRPRDLIKTTSARIVIAAPPCPLGVYTKAYLEQEGFYERLAPRLVLVDNAHAVLAAIQSGHADVGITYSSDAASAGAGQVLFHARRLPVPIGYTGAILQSGQDLKQTRAFIDFLLSPIARRRFRSSGFSPND
jgi:molybdenum ABC transporter molybdate-binding protein